MKSFSSRVAQSRMRMLQTHRAYSFSWALNLFFMYSIEPPPFPFFQISTGYELDSEKSVKCRQWWKRHLESVREMLYRQACGEHKHSSGSSNHSEVCVLPNYLQCSPIGFLTRVVKPDLYICNTSALKMKNKTQIPLVVHFS